MSRMTRTHAVIIGGGVAGSTAAVELAALAEKPRITLIDPAPALKVISTVSRLTDIAQQINVIECSAAEWCENRGINFVQARARSLTPSSVELDDGATIMFDTCCIATGAHPFVPKVLQDERFQSHILTLRDTDSVALMKNRIATARRVLVVGAGGIGMELVNEITGCDVVWLLRGHIGSSFFDESAAEALKTIFKIGATEMLQKCTDSTDGGLGGANLSISQEVHGSVTDRIFVNHDSKLLGSAVGPEWLGRRDGAVIFDKSGNVTENLKEGRLKSSVRHDGKLSIRVAEVLELRSDVSKEYPIVAVLSDGTVEAYDFIIVGTGVIPQVDWVRSCSQLEIHSGEEESEGGIVVQAGTMETGVPNIFAAGDCSHVTGAGENWFQMRLWTQAVTAGRVAAAAMGSYVGLCDVHQGLEYDIFAHVTQFFGKHLVLLGRYSAQGMNDGYQFYERRGSEEFIRVVVENGIVKGALLLGDVECADVFQNLIMTEMNVGWLGERLVLEETNLHEIFD